MSIPFSKEKAVGMLTSLTVLATSIHFTAQSSIISPLSYSAPAIPTQGLILGCDEYIQMLVISVRFTGDQEGEFVLD